MKVVLAEKPSVARDIASVLGATTKRDGYYEGNDYAVTYAFGHLVTIAEPEEMNPAWGKPWRIQQLPMIPAEWKYRVADKAGTQFKIIKKLFSDPATTRIICATDAGREGEHIFRLIYKLSNSKKPVQRLWISSLTAEAIREGFRKLKPGADFDNLADAASARAHADWIVGLTFTRAYTTLNNQLCTIGRVQTPTLALIVERQNAIDSFIPTTFFEVVVTFEPGFIAYYITSGAEPQTRLPDKASAQVILNAIAPRPSGLVDSVVVAEKKTKAPPLYNLLALQKDANRYHGYTAQETLDIAQSLYETYKLISYPRTESRHLSTDMIEELPAIVSTVMRSVTNKVAQQLFAKEGLKPGSITADLLRSRLSKSYVDDTKLTDHHAIIPTHKAPPAELPAKQRNVYHLIVMRFLSIFLPPQIQDETTVILKIDQHSFRARGIVTKDSGWTVLYPKSKDDDKGSASSASDSSASASSGASSESAQPLPPLTKGQQVAKRKADLKKGETTAPKPYDDSSLLTAMKNAGQELDDESLAAVMKQSGLGTPATRAAIIERLIQTGYVERSKKALLPTAKGKAIINAVHPMLKNVALTASWEQQLSDMQDGKLTLSKFETEIASFVRGLMPDVTKNGASLPAVAGAGTGARTGTRTGTGTGTRAGAGTGTGRGSRTAAAPPVRTNPNGRTVTTMRPDSTGIAGGPTRSGSASKPDSPTKSGNSTKEGSPTTKTGSSSKPGSSSKASGLGICPQCKEGMVQETPKGAGCTRWKDGCRFTIWREQYGKKLTDTQIKELVKKGRTKTIKGFKKRDGSGKYDAPLVLGEDFKVRPEFKSTQQADIASIGNCPQCKKGILQSTQKNASCSRWAEGCSFVIWRTQYGKELNDAQIKELIETRRTNPIRGFVRRDGKGTYDARLILSDDFKVRLQFDNS